MSVLVVVGVAAAVLAIVGSESRLTFHQTSRIRAYYACSAGLNYAIEQIKKGVYAIPVLLNPNSYTWQKDDSGLPYEVKIKIYPQGADPPSTEASAKVGCAPITATVDYKYGPP
jgi:hypothetical protein